MELTSNFCTKRRLKSLFLKGTLQIINWRNLILLFEVEMSLIMAWDTCLSDFIGLWTVIKKFTKAVMLARHDKDLNWTFLSQRLQNGHFIEYELHNVEMNLKYESRKLGHIDWTMNNLTDTKKLIGRNIEENWIEYKMVLRTNEWPI